MSHTYHALNYHLVFSTRNRRPLLRAGIRTRLFQYLIGVARNHDITLKSIGGVDDHLHLLIGLRPATAPAKAVQTLKAVSSKWIHETFPDAADLWWQEGYGLFTVSVSHIPATVQYIQSQEEHHATKSFQEEFESFLELHGLTLAEAWTDDEEEV